MNARIAFGKGCEMFAVAGLVLSLLAGEVSAQSWSGTAPVVVSQGYVTAAVPYTTYGSYGGAGPTAIYRPVAAYPSNYTTNYSACPGGNCPMMPASSAGYMYGANTAACPNGQCYINSSCPNGQCYPTAPRSIVYPATYNTYPAYGVPRGTIANPVYYTVPSGTVRPSTAPVYYNASPVIPASTYPAAGGISGANPSPVVPAGGFGSGVDSPFYP
jgi:hypothetical protein